MPHCCLIGLNFWRYQNIFNLTCMPRAFNGDIFNVATIRTPHAFRARLGTAGPSTWAVEDALFLSSAMKIVQKGQRRSITNSKRRIFKGFTPIEAKHFANNRCIYVVKIIITNCPPFSFILYFNETTVVVFIIGSTN